MGSWARGWRRSTGRRRRSGRWNGWSPTLRTTVRLLLTSKAQLLAFWGPEFVALYNDAYAPTIGDKHPAALGRPGREGRASSGTIWSRLLRA